MLTHQLLHPARDSSRLTDIVKAHRARGAPAFICTNAVPGKLQQLPGPLATQSCPVKEVTDFGVAITSVHDQCPEKRFLTFFTDLKPQRSFAMMMNTLVGGHKGGVPSHIRIKTLLFFFKFDL